MVFHNSFPNNTFTCLVQINWSQETGFFLAKHFQDGLDSYVGNIVAIFKCKPKP